MSKSKQELNRDLQDWRISQVLDYLAKGLTQVEISKLLKVHESTISRDVAEIREQAKEQIKTAITEELPAQWLTTRQALRSAAREAWSIVLKDTTTNRDRLAALSLFKDCSKMEYDLVTDTTIIDEAMKLINNDNTRST